MKKIYTSLMLALFLFNFVSGINLEKEVITNVIVPQFDQPAEISLIVSNASPGKYNLYTLTDVSLLPTERFNITTGENRINVKIFPTPSLIARGFYTFIYYLRDSEGVNHRDQMTVKVVDLSDLIEINSNSNYPGDEMRFFVRNKENIGLKNLTANFSSIFFESKETFDLAPFELKEFRVDVNLEKIKKIPAGYYLLGAVFETDRGNGNVIGKIHFGEKKEIDSQSSFDGFFIRTESIVKTNKGNTIETVRIDVKKDLFSSLFTFFSEGPSVVERGGILTKYSWLEEINPGESVEVKVRTNYIVPFLMVLILTGAIFIFKKFNSTKLEIKKAVSHVRTKGGEFALRIKLNVKAHKSLENVSITDRIPALVKIHENFGAIKPSSISLRERKLQWNLGNLEAGEQRSVTYVVYSKVGVVGKFSLPAALAVFQEKENISEAFSNKVFFLSEQVTRVED